MQASLVDRVVSIVATLGVVAAVVLLAEQRFNRPPTAASADRVEFIRDWEHRARNAAVALGDTSGPVKVFVFTDFECPFCARMDSALAAIALKYPQKLARYAVHFPLPGHRFAIPAATAFECAVPQGRSEEMHSRLYRSQDKFGFVDWTELAAVAGVPDTTAFKRCLSGNGGKARVDAGLELTNELSIRRTPVVVVNGWLLDPATPSAVERAIDAAVMGKSP